MTELPLLHRRLWTGIGVLLANSSDKLPSLWTKFAFWDSASGCRHLMVFHILTSLLLFARKVSWLQRTVQDNFLQDDFSQSVCILVPDVSARRWEMISLDFLFCSSRKWPLSTDLQMQTAFWVFHYIVFLELAHDFQISLSRCGVQALNLVRQANTFWELPWCKSMVLCLSLLA